MGNIATDSITVNVTSGGLIPGIGFPMEWLLIGLLGILAIVAAVTLKKRKSKSKTKTTGLSRKKKSSKGKKK